MQDDPGYPAGGGGTALGSRREGLRFRRGWSLPLRPGVGGAPLGERPDPVVDTARLILEVMPGERRLLPEFGCRMHLLGGLDSPEERHLAAVLVEEALRRWVPDLGAERADVTPVDERTLAVAIRVRGTWFRFHVRRRRPTHQQVRGVEEPEEEAREEDRPS